MDMGIDNLVKLVDFGKMDILAVPLTALTKKNVKFVWGPDCQKSFDMSKQALTMTPVLAMPSGQGEFVVYTDSSKLGLGAVLMQHDIVIVYASRQLKANVVADALSRKTVVITQLLVQRSLQAEIQRFELAVYVRSSAPNLSTLKVKSTLRDRIWAGQTSDEQLQKWRQRDKAKGRRLYTVVDGIVRYRDRLWVPSRDSMKAGILSEARGET
ncbi:uncharacterized protein [Primulina huaijiensis]|uniref:uncharacterized protein n=1 Tax=Primulina huaijiensis TaxID=1492673 RepID=UPI003CC74C7D